MNCEQARELLEAHADGSLEPAVAAEVDRHLAGCAPCATRLARLRAILKQAMHLPRSIEPARNLWPDIAARLQARAPQARAAAVLPFLPPSPHGARRRLQVPAWLLAAAAAALIVVSSGVTALLVRSKGVPATTSTGPGLPAALVALERDYTGAVAEIERVLQASRGSMAPEAVVAVERSLRVLDEAIQESRTALARSPENQQLSRLLWATYEQKLDLLKRATRLAGEL